MSDHENKHIVRIHIDQHKYESLNPTTGAELYKIGHVQAGLQLYKEVGGDKEDQPIKNGAEEIHLKEDEHFHSGPPNPDTITIIVNGKAKTEPRGAVLSFADLVKLAFPTPQTGDGVQYTVQYTRGPEKKPSGSLVEGQDVKAKEGMEFDVTPTNRS